MHIDEDEPPPAKKPCTKREAMEDEVEDIFKVLKTKHPSFPFPKLRLWARLIRLGHHGDYETPPDIPLFTGSPTPAKGNKESMSEAFAGAAKAIADVFKSSKLNTPPSKSPSTPVSPMESAQIRRSCLEDLKRVKEFFLIIDLAMLENTKNNSTMFAGGTKNEMTTSIRKMEACFPKSREGRQKVDTVK